MDTLHANRHICKNCRFFGVYYLKSVYCFAKHAAGFCSKKKMTVRETSACDFYKTVSRTQTPVTPERIDAVIADLQELESMYRGCDF